MKYAFALAAVAGLAAANAHVGHERHAALHRRAAETVTDWTVVTVTDVVTVYGPSPVAQHTTPVAVSSHAAEPSAVKASSAPAVVSSPAAVSVPVAVSSPAAVSSHAVVSSPAAVSTPAQQPTTLATVPKAADPSTPAAAPSTPAAASSAPAAATSAAAGGSSSGAGNYGMMTGASIAANCPSGSPCQGDMTTYSTGIGSCGYDDASGEHADDAVALQKEMFGSISNSGMNQPSNKLCNKKIQIKNPKTGATAVGVIRDACPGCSHPESATGAGIDLAPKLFKALNDGVDTGRNPVEWYFLD